MSIQEELERLAEMHRAGTLTDSEFSAAKQRVLARDEETLGKAANRFVKLWAGGAGIGLILALAFFFFFFLPQWQKMGAERESHQQAFEEEFRKDKEKFDRDFDKGFNQGSPSPDSTPRLDQQR